MELVRRLERPYLTVPVDPRRAPMGWWAAPSSFRWREGVWTATSTRPAEPLL
jgi:hypothetical protein